MQPYIGLVGKFEIHRDFGSGSYTREGRCKHHLPAGETLVLFMTQEFHCSLIAIIHDGCHCEAIFFQVIR